MKLAILNHTHKHGVSTYVSLVDDRATDKDSDAIIKGMVNLYGIDYEPTLGPDSDNEGETLDLRLWNRDEIKTVNLDFPEKAQEKEIRVKKLSVF